MSNIERKHTGGTEFEIITGAERSARDPRGLTRFTRIGEDSFIVKKVPETNPVEVKADEQEITNVGDLGGGEDNG